MEVSGYFISGGIRGKDPKVPGRPTVVSLKIIQKDTFIVNTSQINIDWRESFTLLDA